MGVSEFPILSRVGKASRFCSGGRALRPCSSRFDVGDLIEAWLRLLDEFAEARPFLAELGGMVTLP
jgi:hypothetical protein